MNRYKIDWNTYADISYPYALFGKKPWGWRWESIKSFASKEEAREFHQKLIGLPIYLTT